MVAAQRNSKPARQHFGRNKRNQKRPAFLVDTSLSSSALSTNSSRHSVTSRIARNSRLLSYLIFSSRHLNATPVNRNSVEKFNTRLRLFAASRRPAKPKIAAGQLYARCRGCDAKLRPYPFSLISLASRQASFCTRCFTRACLNSRRSIRRRTVALSSNLTPFSALSYEPSGEFPYALLHSGGEKTDAPLRDARRRYARNSADGGRLL
jgi:hypothetical protein